MSNFKNKVMHFLKDERGVSTLEFVIGFPLFFAVVAVTFDAGVLMARYVILENTMDRVVRQIRIGGISSGDEGHDIFKESICSIATIIPDCETSLHVEMIPVPLDGPMPPIDDVKCVDRDDVDNPPATNFNFVAPDKIAFIRACLIVDRSFPSLIQGAFKQDASGGIVMVAKSAFVVEP